MLRIDHRLPTLSTLSPTASTGSSNKAFISYFRPITVLTKGSTSVCRMAGFASTVRNNNGQYLTIRPVIGSMTASLIEQYETLGAISSKIS